jgi:hypothetical protein
MESSTRAHALFMINDKVFHNFIFVQSWDMGAFLSAYYLQDKIGVSVAARPLSIPESNRRKSETLQVWWAHLGPDSYVSVN